MPNPTFGDRMLKSSSVDSLETQHVMTINGTILKTCVLEISDHRHPNSNRYLQSFLYYYNTFR